jgi:hypothetical protein
MMTEDADRLNALVRPHATVAGKIRALAAAGVPRADIARFLGKRYQHVRNVLEGDAQAGGAPGGGYVLGKADLSGVREQARPFEGDEDAAYIDRRSPTAFWLEVKPDGSLPLPKEMAEVLGAQAPGRRFFAEIKDGRVTMMSREAATDEAVAIVCKYIPPDVDLASELLEDRRNGLW